MVFCNDELDLINKCGGYVTILILIDGFLQYFLQQLVRIQDFVTILILIDGFLQLNIRNKKLRRMDMSQSLF